MKALPSRPGFVLWRSLDLGRLDMWGLMLSLEGAELFWRLVLSYMGIGLVVGMALCLGLVGRFDPVAARAPWNVRLLFLPGMILLWPLMIIKAIKGKR
ncbi:hypothetical protein [Asticcacaulis sp. AC402]|uniref:hypothetical protein n=1 Tax=Asticcacaulis sp. AC402 TaxID=1282361 RepID=UPI0003C3E47B|nr:hypothetical protein [Asticcacaulis sp. AC402]ESQ74959.1 hypothetical protein ABAC402_11185 [Asticcacaulis sp. AC402]